MIPQNAITAWRNIAPWGSPDQVEHDLVLSRAICELYNRPVVAGSLLFRGGTALHKLFFERSGRFSEDLDFVQIKAEPIGVTIDAIRECLDHWLGNPSRKQNEGRFTLNYRFKTEIEPIISRKVKIEINTREHFNVQPTIKRSYSVNNSWYQGECNVQTYSLEELLATKFRALYQRKKGRDLYDLWYVVHQFGNVDIRSVIKAFEYYMLKENIKVSRAEFEMNLFDKKNDIVFTQDILPLLSIEQAKQYQVTHAFEIVLKQFVVRLSGEPWQGIIGS
jgi:predicted nucleotidyltransferase component of viral defense system